MATQQQKNGENNRIQIVFLGAVSEQQRHLVHYFAAPHGAPRRVDLEERHREQAIEKNLALPFRKTEPGKRKQQDEPEGDVEIIPPPDGRRPEHGQTDGIAEKGERHPEEIGEREQNLGAERRKAFPAKRDADEADPDAEDGSQFRSVERRSGNLQGIHAENRTDENIVLVRRKNARKCQERPGH